MNINGKHADFLIQQLGDYYGPAPRSPAREPKAGSPAQAPTAA